MTGGKGMKRRKDFAALLMAAGGFMASGGMAGAGEVSSPLVIERQGSFAVGGTVVAARQAYDPAKPQAAGQTLHGDHASVFYQIPADARRYPLVFLHGAGLSSRSWDTTPDGRDGFRNIFLRRGFGVYLVDQPRRGTAGRSTAAGTVSAEPDEAFWFGQFRMGIWPDFFEGTRFARTDGALEQFFRQMTPNTGPYDAGVISGAVSALFSRIGDGILVTHSQGCGPGWLTAMKSGHVRGIVAYEPGSGFVFPEGELPEPVPNASFFGPLKGLEVPREQFMALTRIPIVIYYGDFILEKPVSAPHQDYWRASLRMARLWAETVNRHGGDVTVVHLPDAGMTGNTHFMFSDQNNVQVADLLSQWLKEKGLDGK